MTENMELVLRTMGVIGRSATPNDIAAEAGFRHGDARRLGYSGGWSGAMAPAQKIIPTLTALRNRGLIARSARPDRRSGTAYVITAEGRAEIAELDAKSRVESPPVQGQGDAR